MTQKNKLPKFDSNGINIDDPNDTLGFKLKYISTLQEIALKKYIGNGSGNALDIGCAYGRMADILYRLGYKVTGVDPAKASIDYAMKNNPFNHTYLLGQLPNLPVSKSCFDLVCLFHIARVLHLLDIKDICTSATEYVKSGGKLIIIDNLKVYDKNYIEPTWFDETFERNGLKKILQVPIRSSRWPIIYLIRYGLIPEKYFNQIANWELARMSKKKKIPKLSYFNYLIVYEKQS